MRAIRFAPCLALSLFLTAPVAAQEAPPPPARTAVFRVSGMTCALCARAIDRSLHDVEGVRDVEIDRRAERVAVVADPSVPAARLEEAIERAGRYEAEPIE